MKRIAVVATVSVLALCGVSAAIAGIVEDRQALMKSFGPATKDALGFKNGTTPFDAAKVKATMQIYIDAAAKMDKLFATAPKADEKTKASAKIWAESAGFKAEVSKFSADAKAAAATTDTASFAAAFTKVTADCSSCHGAYREK